MESPIITNDSLYFQQYCSNYTGGDCLEWVTILGIGKEELKQMGVEVLTTPLVFGSVLLILVWFIKGFFRLILSTKGKR